MAPPSPTSTIEPPSSRAPTAIAVFYFVWLGAIGLFWPYFTLWLRALGYSEQMAARMLGLSPAMGLLVPPLVGLLADARRARSWLLRAAAGLTTLAFGGIIAAAALGPSASWIPMALAVALFSLVRAPMMSLVDAAAVEQRRGGVSSFGRLRLWGSLGFLVAAMGGGWLFDALGVDALRWLILGTFAAGACCAWFVPTPPVEKHPEAVSAWLSLLRDRRQWLFLGAAALVQAAGASFDAGFSMHVIRLGHSRAFVGLAWSVGVAAEVLMLYHFNALAKRFRAERMYAVAISAAVLRWALMSRVTSTAAILALQPLHALSFGLWYAAGVQIARQRAGAAPTASQGLFGAASASGSLVGMWIAGALLARGGGSLMYGAAAGIALVAAVVAWRHVVESDAARSFPVAIDEAGLPPTAGAVG